MGDDPKRERALDEAVDERLAGCDLPRIAHVDEWLQVEIAVADMPEDRRDQP